MELDAPGDDTDRRAALALERMSSLRVALVYRNFTLAGSLERETVLLARGLVAQGVEVHCYCDPETRTLEPDGVMFHDVPALARSRSRLGYPVELASFAWAATRAVRRDRSRYDVVDVGGISAWEHDVIRVHEVTRAQQRRWPHEGGRTYRAARTRARLAPVLRPQVAVARGIGRLQLRPGRFRRLIAVTEQVREDLRRVHGIAPDVVDVIPPPIDLTSLARRDGAGMRRSLGLADADAVLLFVGHDFERKGLAEAIEAVAGLEQPARLLVVGQGPRDRYAAIAERAGAASRVHFLGPTEAPERFFEAADLLVLPTRSEPWGITVIEAMAAGVPVVTTQVAGAAEVVRAAGAGVVLDDGSPRRLRAAISALLADPGLREAMARRGRRAARPFGPDGYAASVLATYERALRA